MARIVSAILMSHTTFMVELVDRADAEQVRRFSQGLDEARRALLDSQPDVVLVSGSDHVRTFFYDKVPAFCIGIGEQVESWGDGASVQQVEIHDAMARFLLRQALMRGWDLAYSENMKLDHAFMIPITQLFRERRWPVIPLFQNCNLPPYASMQRCLEVGGILRQAIEAWPGDTRVALVGSGGISHWVGVPRMGDINEEFDRRFLGQIEQGDLEAIGRYSEEEIEEQGGNGAQELRAWATVIGAVPDFRWRIACYEPIKEWATGMGIMIASAPGKEEGASA